MKTLVEFIIYLATAGVSLQNVMGNRRIPAVSCVNSAVARVKHPGDPVTVSCKYPPTEGGGIRHFCREDETSRCINLISAQTVSLIIKDRFSLRDDKQRGEFYVTISTVTHADGGRYKCLLESAGNSTAACLTEIQLIVSDPNDTVAAERDIRAKTPPPHDAPLKKGIAVVAVGVLGSLILLMTGTLVLLLVRHRLPRTKVCCPVGGSNAASQTEENHRHSYEDIQLLDQQATSRAAVHSVYATAGQPPNQLHHQHLSSNGRETCDANENASSAHDHSSVNGNTTHPQTVYSALKMPAEP